MDINSLKTKQRLHNFVMIKQDDKASSIDLLLCGSDGKVLTGLSTTATVTVLDERAQKIRATISGVNVTAGNVSFKINQLLNVGRHTIEVVLSNGQKFPGDGDFTLMVTGSHSQVEINVINSTTKSEALAALDSSIKAFMSANSTLFKGRDGKPGEDGKPGRDGRDGVSPTASQVAPLLQPSVTYQVKAEFDKLNAGKQLDGEVVSARNSFSSLNDRLNGMESSTARSLEQPDFVEKLKDLLHFDEVQVGKSTATTVTVTNFNKTTERHLTNVFSKNANDDYWILSDSYVGGTSTSEFPKDYKNYEKVSGTIDTTYATHWASKGTKIKAEISGSEIYFRRYADNRGGMWEFTLDGDATKKVQLSVYKPVTTAVTDDVKIFSGLEDKIHLIEAEFIGDDPNNPPSTGMGNSRGWLYYNATNDINKAFKAYFNNLNLLREKTLNVALSNKDFALQSRKAGTSDEFHFIPEHNATGTAFKIADPQFLLDGKAINFDSVQIGIKFKGLNFSLIQTVYGRHPVTKENLMQINTFHEINRNGVVRILGKVVPLTDVEIKDGYFLMLPVQNDTGRRLKTSRYNYYPATKNDGTRTNLIAEKDDTSSFIFTNEANPNIFSAMTIHDANNTLRTGMANKYPVGQTAWIEHRASSTLQKLYNSIYRFGILRAGESLTFDGSFLSGEIPNVHNML